MSKKTYQITVLATLILPLILLIGELLIWPDAFMDAELREIFNAYATTHASGAELIAMGVVVLFIIPCSLACVYGLMRFRKWAPKFGWWLSGMTYLLLLFTSPVLQSGFGGAVLGISTMAWGIVIAMPYMNPLIRSAFWPERA